MSAPKHRDGQPVQGYIMDAYHQTLLGQIEVNFDDCFTSPHTGELLYGKTNHKGYKGNLARLRAGGAMRVWHIDDQHYQAL
jgi:hypothetical protein